MPDFLCQGNHPLKSQIKITKTKWGFHRSVLFSDVGCAVTHVPFTYFPITCPSQLFPNHMSRSPMPRRVRLCPSYLRPSYLCPGHPHCPGHPCPSHPCPGHPFPGHPCPGHPCPSHPCPGHPCMPGRLCPSYLCPSYLCTGHPCPGHSCPGRPCPSHLCPEHPWGGPSPLRPMAKRFLANGRGPKWAFIFFIVSLAWSCDETNFKLLLRKTIFKKKVKISVRFQGLRKISLRQKKVFV